MAISYPLTMPSRDKMASIELQARNATAVSRSPFTFSEQVQAWPGQAWEADVRLPPMQPPQAEPWLAFLTALRGQYGTFYLGDPARPVPRGTARGDLELTGTAGSGTLTLAIGPFGTTLLGGDYIQVGAGNERQLLKVLSDVTLDPDVEIDVWPAMRVSGTRAGIIQDTTGLFRLASNEAAWSVDRRGIYTIAFGAREAV